MRPREQGFGRNGPVTRRPPRRRRCPAILRSLLGVAVCSFTGCGGLRGRAHPTEIPLLPVERAAALGLGSTLRYIDRSRNPGEPLVQLRCRRSLIVKSLAVHPWFLTYDPEPGRWDEWDVYAIWGSSHDREIHTLEVPSRDGRSLEQVRWATQSWGYVGKLENRLFITSGTHADIVLAEWHGADAVALLEVLRRPEDYPHGETYHYWPGPNSNTYVAWVLRRAGVRADLHPLSVGKDYLGFYGLGAWTTTTGTGIQVESPLVGLKLGLLDGVELHILSLTFGIDLWPPALKLPLGRFGVAE